MVRDRPQTRAPHTVIKCKPPGASAASAHRTLRLLGAAARCPSEGSDPAGPAGCCRLSLDQLYPSSSGA
eukprot:3590925-Alexandrium_andersonii.AAC.1